MWERALQLPKPSPDLTGLFLCPHLGPTGLSLISSRETEEFQLGHIDPVRLTTWLFPGAGI